MLLTSRGRGQATGPPRAAEVTGGRDGEPAGWGARQFPVPGDSPPRPPPAPREERQRPQVAVGSTPRSGKTKCRHTRELNTNVERRGSLLSFSPLRPDCSYGCGSREHWDSETHREAGRSHAVTGAGDATPLSGMRTSTRAGRGACGAASLD